MSPPETPAPPGIPTLPEALRLGPVELTVTDLDRSIAFYEQSIGLRLGSREGSVARLEAGGRVVLVLVEDRDARPPGRRAGLYHFALLHPSRRELARAVRRLAATRTPIQGASDHGISEAIYLPDPDGNGIELAADRPREEWGPLRDPATIGPRPLDMQSLLALVPEEEAGGQASEELVVGHLHLHIGDVDEALAFYRDLIGFEVQTLFPSAAFVSAGGYHHHLGLNTWRGEGVGPAPDDAVGLRCWTVFLPERAQVEDVATRLRAVEAPVRALERGFETRDPWSNAVRFESPKA